MKIDFSHIAIEIIDGCNYSCGFCIRNAIRGKKNQLTPFELESWMTKIAFTKKIDLLSLTGGEPFLHTDLLDILKIAEKYAQNITITTNGSIYKKDIFSWMSKNPNTNFIISLDSNNPTTHNSIRGNTKAYKNVIKFIKLCHRYAIPFFINITVGLDNYKSVYKTIEKAVSLGAENISVALVKPEGRAENNIDNTILTEVGFQVVQAQQDFFLTDIIFSDPLSHIFNPHELKYKDYHFCAAGSNVLHIQNDGTILMCTASHEVLGNIRDIINLSTLHKDARIQSIRERKNMTGICGKCDFLYSCSGCRCRASKVDTILSTDFLCPLSNVLSVDEEYIVSKSKEVGNEFSNADIIFLNPSSLKKIDKNYLSRYKKIVLTPFILDKQETKKIIQKFKESFSSGQEIYIFDKFNDNIPILLDSAPILQKNKIYHTFSRKKLWSILKKINCKHIQILYFDIENNFLIKGTVL